MTRVLSERWMVVLSLGLAACGAEHMVNHSVTSGLPISVKVTPSAVSLLCGQSVQLVANVTADTGVNRAVKWWALMPFIADVDATGVVHAYGPGTASIMAGSVADPDKAGFATITVAGEPPTLTISQVTEAGTGQPANYNAATDSLDVTFMATDGSCVRGAMPWVSVTAQLTNGQDSLSATAPVPAEAGTGVVQVTVRLNTTAKNADGTPLLENGSYSLSGVLLGSNGTAFRSSNAVLLSIAN